MKIMWQVLTFVPVTWCYMHKEQVNPWNSKTWTVSASCIQSNIQDIFGDSDVLRTSRRVQKQNTMSAVYVGLYLLKLGGATLAAWWYASTGGAIEYMGIGRLSIAASIISKALPSWAWIWLFPCIWAGIWFCKVYKHHLSCLLVAIKWDRYQSMMQVRAP